MRDPDAILTALGAKIRTARLRRGWTQRALCSHAGISQRFVSQLESGRANISVVRLAEVAAALEVSLERLVEGITPPPSAAGRGAKVALIGVRGAGKSTIGARAAAALDAPFIVVDHRVRTLAGMPLSDLFELRGRAGYHQLCATVLEELLAEPGPAILELGGSVVEDAGLWARLGDRALTVWLQARPEAHLMRVAAQGDRRPAHGMPDAIARLREILTARRPQHERADVTVDTEARGIQGSVDDVIGAVYRVQNEG